MIYNFTQHEPTPEQVIAGVINLPDDQRETMVKLLSFNDFPYIGDIQRRANHLSSIAFAIGAEAVMIGGAPYLMPALELAMSKYGIKVLYSFSQRVSNEYTDSLGNVVKTNSFKHIGFVEASK